MGFVKTALFEGGNILGGVASYKDSKSQGHGAAYSIGKAVGEYALFELLPGPVGFAFMAKDIAGAAFGAVNAAGRETAATQSRHYKANFGGNFRDSSNAATMRQRGLQAIQQNGMNARSVLGSEARSYYRGLG